MESAVEPCKVRTLVVPIGSWHRHSYDEALSELQRHQEIRLVDVTPLSDCTFNPQLFPNGRVLYSFLSREYESNSAMFLHDFEPYRKLFVVIGLCNDVSLSAEYCVNELKERFGSAISYNVIYSESCGSTEPNSKFGFCAGKEPLETIMCDITRNFLEALDVYYSSYKHVTLRSPGAIGGPSVLKTIITKYQQSTATISMTPSKRVLSHGGKDELVGSGRTLGEDSPRDKPKRYSSLNTLGGGTSDKSMQQSKARQLKLLANLQLLAGQYQSSMANFAEAARILHKIHDYIWLGNSLEGISTCMLLLSYLQIPFQIPGVIQSMCSLSQAAGNNTLPVTTSRRTSMQSVVTSPRSSISTSNVISLDATGTDMPRLITAISEKALYYYDYSHSYSVEFTPQVVYCKSILRTLSFMSLCYKANDFSQNVLREMILGSTPINEPSHNHTAEHDAVFSRTEIYHFSGKIFELQLKSMDLASQLEVYLTLCAIYDNLAMHRKKAFVLRILFISVLSHNADNLLEDRYETLIDSMMDVYKIVISESDKHKVDASHFDWATLQKNVLTLTIKIYTHFRNFAKVVEHAIILLQKFSHTLTKLEQLNLLNRCLLPYQNQFDFTYMDPYLVKDITFSRPRSEEMPMLKLLSVKNQSNTVDDTHQVFNPFAPDHRKDNMSEDEDCNYFLVAETVQMMITLENPYKFDVDLQEINFCEEDREFMSISNPELTSFVLPANSRRQYSVGVTFTDPTMTLHKLKGLKLSFFNLPPAVFSITRQNREPRAPEKTLSAWVPMRIIEQQPTLSVVSTSLVNNRLMLLDGMNSSFQVFLRNTSLSSPINYCNISYTSNVENDLKENYRGKLAADNVHDIELQLQWLKRNLISTSPIPENIGINESFQLGVDLDVSRAPFSLKWVRITIQYGFKKSPEDTSIYVKTISIPIEITLQRVLEVPNVNFISIPEAFEEKSTISWIQYLQQKNDNVPEYALMLIDMRNSWLDSVSFKFQFDDFISGSERLDSNETRRFIVPIRKIFIDQGSRYFKHIPIPRIDETKQYITSGLTALQEEDMRQKFWCREHILDRLRCEWKTHSTRSLSGIVDFRQYLEKLDEQTISLIYPASNPFDVKVTASHTVVKPGTPVKLTVMVNTTTNSSLIPLKFFVIDYYTGRLLNSSPQKSILIHGQTLTMVKPHTSSELVILPLKSGRYQVHFEVPGNSMTRDPLTITVQCPQ